MGIKDFARLTDLFSEGAEVVLQDGDEPLLLWVSKLNSFESEECRRDGQAARSRLVLALKEIGSPETVTFEASLAEMGDERLVDALADADNSARFMEVYDDIRNDPDWKERLEISQRRNQGELSDEERELLKKIDSDYAAETEKRIANARSQAIRDLDRMPVEELRDLYREKWRDAQGMRAFRREFNKTQLFFSVRPCSAKRSDSGGWDHGHCGGHRKRMLDDRDEVAQLPGQLLDRLLEAVQQAQVDRRDARFLGGQESSSASSAQPSEAAASTPSTPQATSPELVTTSS